MRSTCVLESRPLGMRQMQREVKRNKNRGSIRVWQRGHHCAPVRRRDPSLRYFAQSLSRCTPVPTSMGARHRAGRSGVRGPCSHAAHVRASRFDLLCLVVKCTVVYTCYTTWTWTWTWTCTHSTPLAPIQKRLSVTLA